MYDNEYEIEEDEPEYPQYQPPIPHKRASRTYDPHFYNATTQNVKVQVKQKGSSRGFLLVGAMLIFCMYLIWVGIVHPWIEGIQNHWMYGEALISEASGNVGHGGISTFFCYDNNGEIIVIEVVGQKYKVYTGLISNENHELVTIAIRDVNGNGKPDVVLSSGDQTITLINTGTDFKWQQ